MKVRNYLRRITLKAVTAFVVIISTCGTVSAAFTKEGDAYPLFYLQRNLAAILVNDNIAPPVAMRDFVYPHLAANYILSSKDAGKKIYASIHHFPQIKLAEGTVYSPSLAAAYAFYEVARKLIYTEKPFVDSFPLLLKWYRTNGMDEASFASSKKMGESVAAQIIQWMSEDGFAETRTLNKYVLMNSPGKWQPTAPGYFPAVEPHWGEIRPMISDTVAGLNNYLPIPYDSSVKSSYYQEAKRFYDITGNLSAEQKNIAAFWDCNPFALHPAGHVQSFVKKMSPGAHWLYIAEIACHRKQMNIAQTSRILTLTSIALFDAFIYTWKLKYIFNSWRPETFIQQSSMDPVWQPFIQAPPFPEFPSGHAVISSAAALILTDFFGKDFSYTDDTESSFGLEPRSFHSFKEAAQEASISRVYGGIHYPSSCKTGEQLGEAIASRIITDYRK